MLDGDNAASAAIFPGMTTLIIVVTFLLTIYQLYRYVIGLMNAKGDFADYQSQSVVDRTPLVAPQGRSRAPSISSDGYVGAAAETFDFDTSEVGAFAMYENFEEYSGPQLSSHRRQQKARAEERKADEDDNQAFSSLDKIMQGSKVMQRDYY